MSNKTNAKILFDNIYEESNKEFAPIIRVPLGCFFMMAALYIPYRGFMLGRVEFEGHLLLFFLLGIPLLIMGYSLGFTSKKKRKEGIFHPFILYAVGLVFMLLAIGALFDLNRLISVMLFALSLGAFRNGYRNHLNRKKAKSRATISQSDDEVVQPTIIKPEVAPNLNGQATLPQFLRILVIIVLLIFLIVIR